MFDSFLKSKDLYFMMIILTNCYIQNFFSSCLLISPTIAIVIVASLQSFRFICFFFFSIAQTMVWKFQLGILHISNTNFCIGFWTVKVEIVCENIFLGLLMGLGCAHCAVLFSVLRTLFKIVCCFDVRVCVHVYHFGITFLFTWR